jgi:hypothetical protein
LFGYRDTHPTRLATSDELPSPSRGGMECVAALRKELRGALIARNKECST